MRSTRCRISRTSDFLYARQVNFETIHAHDVLAEREGTVGELRAELRTAEPTERHTSLADWLGAASAAEDFAAALPAPEREAALGARPEARDVLLVEQDDRRPRRSTAKTITGHGSPSASPRNGSESAVTIEASEA